SGCATAWSAAVSAGALAHPRAATAPSTSTVRKRCGVLKRSSASSRNSLSVYATPRTRKSSTPSWRSTGAAPRPAAISRRSKIEALKSRVSQADCLHKPDGQNKAARLRDVQTGAFVFWVFAGLCGSFSSKKGWSEHRQHASEDLEAKVLLVAQAV